MGKGIAFISLLAMSMALIALAGCTSGAQQGQQAGQQGQNTTYTISNSFDIAKAWIEKSPTYSFDGSGLKYLSSSDEYRCPYCFSYNFSFTSSHEGYGDRSGAALAQAATRHEIFVLVNDGVVEAAEIDGKWDELAQGYIGAGVGPQQGNASAGQGSGNGTGHEGSINSTGTGGEVLPPAEAVNYNSSLEVARDFIIKSRTYGADSYNLQFASSDSGQCAACWVFRFSYTSPQEGYGPRANASNSIETHHDIEVATDNGAVSGAIVDGKYDELSQRMLGDSGGQVANPASQNCIDNGYNLTIVRDAAGGESGMCSKPGYSSCEEWAFYRGECEIKPGCNVSSACPSGSSCYYYKPCMKLEDGTTSCGMERGDAACHPACSSDSDCTGGLSCREVTVNAEEASTIVRMCLWQYEGKFCGGIAGFACPEGYECKLDGDYPDASGTCAKTTAAG